MTNSIDRTSSTGETRDTNDLSRRDFGAISMAAGALAAYPAIAADPLPVVEKDVEIKTPDGVSDSVIVHPTTGVHPGVLIWTDALGLRPAFRDMAKHIAAQGYTVLVPNPFYRSARVPVMRPGFDFQNTEDRARLTQLMGVLTAPGAAERDAAAFVAYLDAHAAMKKTSKIGTNGYCMGGPLTMRTAASLPNRIAAAGSFHGGGLVTDKPESPHLMVPKMKVSYYFGIATNDDKAQPEAKDVLKATFAAAKLPAKIEVYEGANHGWCMPDSQIYNKPQAERAMAELLALYKSVLV